MRKRFLLFSVLSMLLAFLVLPPAKAQKRKIQNRPYIDQRRFHYGFSVGMNMQDFELTNTRATTESGETWYADVADYSPGFSVGILGELYLTKHLALRLLPTLHFGSKNVVFRNYNSPEDKPQTERQNVKSTYISLPLDLKFSAPRFNNYRPYLMAGVNPMYNLNVKKGEHLRFKPMNLYAEVGLGCDYYFPFFKFIPELKFCFGLLDIINKDRNDLSDQSLTKFRDAVSQGSSKMIVLTFYFE